MGVDIQISLPDGTRARDVMRVIGIAAGLPASNTRGWVDVDEITLAPSSIPECASIEWLENEELRHVLFHFEWTGGGCGLLPRSTPFWCAVALKLVSLFGGKIQWQDCANGWDLSIPANPLRLATNGKEWDALQEAILAAGPITEAELKDAAKVAAYQVAWYPPLRPRLTKDGYLNLA